MHGRRAQKHRRRGMGHGTPTLGTRTRRRHKCSTAAHHTEAEDGVLAWTRTWAGVCAFQRGAWPVSGKTSIQHEKRDKSEAADDDDDDFQVI